jgi:hypothetical protein
MASSKGHETRRKPKTEGRRATLPPSADDELSDVSLDLTTKSPSWQGAKGAQTVARLERLAGNQAVQRLIADGIAKKLDNEQELAKKLDNEQELAKVQREMDGVAVQAHLVVPTDGRAQLPRADEAGLLSKASVNVASGAAATQALGGDYGLTYPESVEVTISAKKDKTAAAWSPRVKKLLGHYSMQTSLLAGQTEITGPAGNTTSANFCSQCENLKSLGNTVGNTWYIIRAVVAHERVHATRFKPGLANARKAIVTAIEATSVPDIAGMKEKAAIKQLEGDPGYQAAVTGAQATWLAEILKLVAGDHATDGPCDKAEKRHTEPLRKSICNHAKKKKWGACPHC